MKETRRVFRLALRLPTKVMSANSLFTWNFVEQPIGSQGDKEIFITAEIHAYRRRSDSAGLVEIPAVC